MYELKEHVQSIFNRTFYGINPLPLPSYILSSLFLFNVVPSLPFINTMLFLISKLLTLSLIDHRSIKNILNIFLFMILSSFEFIKSTSINSYFAVIFTVITLKHFLNQNYFLMCFFLSLLTVTDTSFTCIMFSLAITLFINTYNKLIDPKNNVKKTVIHSLKILSLILVVPMTFYFGFISSDLLIRNRHSKNGLSFSLPFQSTLENFDISQGFTDGHIKGSRKETDLYVMDRSIISMMSKKHNSFFTINDDIKGSKSYKIFCEIHKIHSSDFEDEEPRFIKDGDFVKFKHITEDKFVGMKRKDPSDKFIDLSIGVFENDEDLWKVSTDGYLKTLSSEVEFINVASGDNLCAKVVNDKPNIYGSFYSEVKSRIFYIAGNLNHEYFRDNFHDYKVRMATTEYSRHSFIKKLIEYLKTLDFKNNSSMEKVSLIRTILCIFWGAMSILILLLNGIAINRYNLGIKISENTKIYTTTFILTCLFIPIFGFRPFLISSIGLISFISLIEDSINMSRSKITFNRIPKKIKDQ